MGGSGQRFRAPAAPAVMAALLALGGAVACGGASSPVDRAGRSRLTVPEVLAGDATGFARALEPQPFVFPRDHGNHPAFRTEWWYFTGNVTDSEARRFGFQVTFFRSALAPSIAGPAAAETPSPWRARDLWMAHLALGDFGSSRFVAHERFARGALGLAGAAPDSLRVWVHDWSAVALRPEDPESPVRVRAAADDVAVDLVLAPLRAPLPQGRDGLSQKGSEPGNASYYYSVTRWQAEGTVTAATQQVEVTGAAWLDREWSSSALEAGQVGWDWFALQLDDGSDLMLYVMRRDDATVDPASSGTWLSPAGRSVHLQRADFQILPREHWTSPTGIEYPSRWRLVIPRLDLELEVVPRMPTQELDLSFRYWEGAVTARGRRGATAVSGEGFAELTGYAAADLGSSATGAAAR